MLKPLWTVRFSETSLKTLQKIHPQEARRITDYLKKRVISSSNPRSMGQPLQGPLDTFWRYRVGDYRLLADIEDAVLTVYIIKIAHRKEVYKH